MRCTLGSAISALAAIAAVAQPSAAAETGKIVVTATQVKMKNGGSLIFALCNSKETWLKPKQAYARIALPARADPTKATFQNVPYGDTYAVMVFHDKNGNGKLDMHFFPPRPKEGAGVSNNERRMGKPRFSRASFALGKPTVSLEIKLRY